MRKHCLILQELSRAVDRRNLASCAEAGIDSKRRLHAGGRRQQQLAQVLLERSDRLDICVLLPLPSHLADQRELHQAVERILQHLPVELAHLVVAGADFRPVEERENVAIIELQLEVEHSLGLAAT